MLIKKSMRPLIICLPQGIKKGLLLICSALSNLLANLFDKSYKKQKENYELNEQVYLIKHKKAKSSIIFSNE